MTEPTQRRIRTQSGLDLAVLEWNARAAHTIVLVHGFLDLAWSFAQLASHLGEFHIVAPDMRGHGDSDRIGAGGYYHFFDYVPDLADVIAACAGPELTLVGHSMGGTICAYTAATLSERVTRLALLEGLGPPAESEPAGPERTQAWMAAMARVRDKPQRSYSTLAEAAARLRDNDPLLSVPLSEWLAEKSTRRGSDARLRFKHDPLHVTRGPYPFVPEVALRFFSAVRCPVLLVDGAESAWSSTAGAARAAAFSNAHHRSLPGAGHMMQRHQPEALAGYLRDFIFSTRPV